MIKNINNKEENAILSSEQKERTQKLQLIIDKFEKVSNEYGPVSSNELKDRINKIIRNFDKEFKMIIGVSFNKFWNSRNSLLLPNEKNSDSETYFPNFLRNFKK